MVDYNKQTVAQLRQLLKDRGIPSTGLTRKAQIIEKLEEADSALESSNAPPDTASRAEERVEENQTASEAGVPKVALAEAGEPQAQSEPEVQTEPVPAATTDSLPETISHIDSDVPPPDRTQAIEQPAEAITKDDEPGSIQPAEIFNPPPADPEEVVGPKVTEPADAEVEAKRDEDIAHDKLPDAPGPAAEALRMAHQGSEVPRASEDITMDEKPPSVTSNEQESVEKPDLATGPANSVDGTSRLNTEELEADSRKRKRRSDTPEMDPEEIRAKKHRQSQDPAPEVHLKEDGDVVMEQRPEEEQMEHMGDVQHDQTNGKQDLPPATDFPATEADIKRERKEKAARYKDLVKSSDNEMPQEALTDDRPTVPALHPVTSALYIRNFMRPLRPEPLRAHLVSIASPPSSSPDPTIVKALFLDAMKTHALVLFSTKIAASRVRASLHGSIWPPEGMRKELWVDFVPEESVESWIKEEEDAVAAEKEARASGRPTNPKRFEVIYPESSDGTVTAVFQEVGSSAPINAPRGPRGNDDTRRLSVQQHHLAPTDNPRQNTEASFKTLHELFQSTQAKPQLFYLPVSDEISETRLKELDAETSRDWTPGEIRKGRGIKTEMKYKYSFDEEDRIVEVGEDRGPWSEGYRGGRGGFRGRRGGGFRGRGGDTWRG